MRDGDPVADTGGAHRLARLQHRREEVAVEVGREWQHGDDPAQHLGLGRTSDVPVHAALVQERGQRRRWPVRRALGLLEQAARHRYAVLHRPFPQLDRVAVQALVDAVNGQAPRRDPAANGSFGDDEVRRGFRQRELHARRRRGWWRRSSLRVAGARRILGHASDAQDLGDGYRHGHDVLQSGLTVAALRLDIPPREHDQHTRGAWLTQSGDQAHDGGGGTAARCDHEMRGRRREQGHGIGDRAHAVDGEAVRAEQARKSILEPAREADEQGRPIRAAGLDHRPPAGRCWPRKRVRRSYRCMVVPGPS